LCHVFLYFGVAVAVAAGPMKKLLQLLVVVESPLFAFD